MKKTTFAQFMGIPQIIGFGAMIIVGCYLTIASLFGFITQTIPFLPLDPFTTDPIGHALVLIVVYGCIFGPLLMLVGGRQFAMNHRYYRKHQEWCERRAARR